MTAPVTVAESNAIGGEKINPAPDGRPWDKCCSHPNDDNFGCQCFMKKPANHNSRFDWHIKMVGSVIHRLLDEKGRFFCIHRTDGEYHRECAGWAAKITGNRP